MADAKLPIPNTRKVVIFKLYPKMYVNTSATTSGSYSLTFLGKKVGRHQSVAPAGKQSKCTADQE